MRLGELRHLMRLERPAEGPLDSLGQAPLGWEPVGELYAKIEPLSGRELELARTQEARVTHRITTRYQAGITAQMRLKMGARIFNLTSVVDVDEQHDELQLMAQEVVL